MRPSWIVVWLVFLAGAAAAEPVRIGVLGLFHPTELELSGKFALQLDGNPVEASGPVLLVLDNGSVLVRSDHAEWRGAAVEASGAFVLAVPQKLERRYQGELRVEADGEELLAVVSMNLETAVQAVLDKEGAQRQPAALEAQAIVSRSFLAAGKRHDRFDFCDTTHCQWLGEIAKTDSALAKAARRTEGLAVHAGERVVQALFTSRCGGRTHTLREIGLQPENYPFYSVDCEACRRNPRHWERSLAATDAPEIVERPGLESSRLAVVRRLGWSALPGNDYSLTRSGDRLLLKGIGEGHGVGLCQAGSEALAARGATALEILRHYFPNTRTTSLQ